MLFTAADEFNEFNLAQHFDIEKEPDVRLRMHGLYERTKETVARERFITLEVALLVGLLESQNAAVNLGLGKKENLARSLGLSEDAYRKRAQAGRVLIAFPQFIDLVKRGVTFVSHIGGLSSKITRKNADVFFRELPGKTEREVRELAASVNKDGSRSKINPLFDLRLRFTKEQLARLDRAREVLSATGRMPSEEEAILKSLEDLLEKRDPVQKAARAEQRAQKKGASAGADDVPALPQVNEEGEFTELQATTETAAAPLGNLKLEVAAVPHRDLSVDEAAVPHGNLPADVTPMLKSKDKEKPRGRRGIPAATVHHVWNRDRGCCTAILPDGTRCSSKIGLQVDHVRPIAFGQDNRLENLRILCRPCNIAAAEMILGTAVMERYRWLNMRTGIG